MAISHWLVKQEPETYSWEDFVQDGGTAWTGVRSYPARLHLRGMRVGDRVLFYHSVSDKRIVGVARVSRAAYPDPTAGEGDWLCVDLKPLQPLARPVDLDQIKSDPALKELPLLRQSRLSVMPVTQAQFDRLLALGGTTPKR